MEMFKDVSFAGAAISVGGANITEFMDDANPIDVQDTEVANIEWSCNGKMIRTVKPSAILVSITVIPGTPSDNALKQMWQDCFSNEGDVKLDKANQALDLYVSLPSGASYSFMDGTCVSGAAAFTANGQGKLGGNTYTFAYSRLY